MVVTLVVLVIFLRECNFFNQRKPVGSISVVSIFNAGAGTAVKVIFVSRGRENFLRIGSITYFTICVLKWIMEWLKLVFRVIYCFLYIVLLGHFRYGMKTIKSSSRVLLLEPDILTYSFLRPLFLFRWRTIDQVPN